MVDWDEINKENKDDNIEECMTCCQQYMDCICEDEEEE